MISFFKRPATKKKAWPLAAEIKLLFLLVFTCFVTASLISYYPFDRTLFYYDTFDKPFHNWCGILGAYVASVLVYCLGMASLGIPLLCLFILYCIISRRSLSSEGNRITALLIACLCCAGLSSLTHTDWYLPVTPGGYCGIACSRLIHSWFNTPGAFLFLVAVLGACISIICRVSIARSITAVVSLCVRLIVLLYRQLYLMGRVVYSLSKKYRSSKKISFEGSTKDNSGSLPLTWHEESSVRPSFVPPIAPSVAQAVAHTNATKKEYEATEAPHHYQLPHLDIFIGGKEEQHDHSLMQELEKRALLLQEKLERFDIHGKVTAIKRGPVITLFEYQPSIDTKLSKIVALEDDLALALQAMSIRIIAPIPGRSVVGFEVANKQRRSVLLSQLIKSEEYRASKAILPMIAGVDTVGTVTLIDLAKMPHLLMAGSTGSGKSVSLNAMLISLLCKCSPDDVRMILIDPKRLEFAPYADIAHLLFPIVTDPKQAPPVLRWVVKQMEERYERMAKAGAKNIADYREKAHAQNLAPLPYIVLIIDELADLMMCAGKEVEDAIIRITQMARAAGIHMIAATQRPSVDVITGLIKVNFPSRISFRVTSKVDSRTILDAGGADKLLGKGDMLFLDATDAGLKRLHGAYVLDQEINQVIAHIRAQRLPDYLDLRQVCSQEASAEPVDVIFDQVSAYLQEVDEISISLLQRRFRIGYNRSARIIETLEHQGMIAPSQGGKTRKVIR